MITVHRLRSSIEAHLERRRFFLREEREEIAQTNLVTLRYASLFTVVALVLLLGFAVLLIRNWQPSPYHYALIPISLAFCAIAWIENGASSYRASIALCASFEAVMYLSIIFIDTLGGPNVPTSFVQLICVALPSLFVLPTWLTYGLLAAAETLYAALVISMKNEHLAQFDLYGMVVGIFFAICVSQLVMESRLTVHELKLRYEEMSKRDTLSNLYNKRAFFEDAQRYFDAHNPKSTCSLAIIDIDFFKRINDSFGHDSGDQILSLIGDILLELYRPTDLVARFGGDEYLVLADRMTNEAIIQRRYEELSTRLAEKSSGIIDTTITFSMGVVIANGQSVDFAALFQQADDALYDAKEKGRNTCTIMPYAET